MHKFVLFLGTNIVTTLAVMPPPQKGKRGAGFSYNEVCCLLEIVEERLPIGASEWDAVRRDHSKYFPDLGRERKKV
jgi:hypothetical protein